MSRLLLFIFLLSTVLVTGLYAESPFKEWGGKDFEYYKKVGELDLRMYHFKPTKKTKYSGYTVLTFFGGGWEGGRPARSRAHASFFAQLGFNGYLPEYRIRKHFKDSNPDEAVEDGVDAYQWLIENAKRLEINPKKIIVCGFSAGGHLAAMIPFKVNKKRRPALVILFAAVLDTSKEGYQGRYSHYLKDKWRGNSPTHLLKKSYSPTIIVAGTLDPVIKMPQPKKFYAKLKKMRVPVELIMTEGDKHGPSQKSLDLTSKAIEKLLK